MCEGTAERQSVPVLADFCGRWCLVRRITDQLLGMEGRFEGEAWFEPTDDGAYFYREAGQLRFGTGVPFVATRRYLWRSEAGRFVVYYEDGRPFHSFDPAEPAARHICTPDDYRVRYDFARWPDWQAEWTVSGPRKDYTMVSRYFRP